MPASSHVRPTQVKESKGQRVTLNGNTRPRTPLKRNQGVQLQGDSSMNEKHIKSKQHILMLPMNLTYSLQVIQICVHTSQAEWRQRLVWARAQPQNLLSHCKQEGACEDAQGLCSLVLRSWAWCMCKAQVLPMSVSVNRRCMAGGGGKKRHFSERSSPPLLCSHHPRGALTQAV